MMTAIMLVMMLAMMMMIIIIVMVIGLIGRVVLVCQRAVLSIAARNCHMWLCTPIAAILAKVCVV